MDIDRIWEQHWENFLSEYHSNEKLQEAIDSFFGYENYMGLKITEDSIYNLWDAMYTRDADLCVSNPISCADSYAEHLYDVQHA